MLSRTALCLEEASLPLFQQCTWEHQVLAFLQNWVSNSWRYQVHNLFSPSLFPALALKWNLGVLWESLLGWALIPAMKHRGNAELEKPTKILMQGGFLMNSSTVTWFKGFSRSAQAEGRPVQGCSYLHSQQALKGESPWCSNTAVRLQVLRDAVLAAVDPHQDTASSSPARGMNIGYLAHSTYPGL